MIESINPATGLVVGSVDETSPEDVPTIVERSRLAQARWFDDTGPDERASLFKGLMTDVLERSDDLASVVSQEIGKPTLEAVDCDVLPVVTMLHWCASVTKEVGRRDPLRLGRLDPALRLAGRSSTIERTPLGVIGIVSPWNFPLAIPMTQAAMAVAAGNSVVIKPSELAPLTASRIPSLFEGAGFPKGLVSIVHGRGGVGNALVSSDVDRVVFTGGWRTGMDVMRAASARLTPVTLELGGKDPMVVLEDCDLDRTVAGATWGSFVNAGQVCAAVKRILVHGSIRDRFMDMFVKSAGSLRMGWDPDGHGVDMGPLITMDAVERMEDVVERAVSDGARLMCGGSPSDGCFYPPTILGDVTPSMEVFREEVFGPVVTVTSFEDDEEAVSLANDSDFALSASIWSKDMHRAQRLARSVHGGTVTINNVAYTYGLPTAPWGGSGRSGFGRSHGSLGLDELTVAKHVHVDRGRLSREVWWHPYSQVSMESLRCLVDVGFGNGGWRGLPITLRRLLGRDR